MFNSSPIEYFKNTSISLFLAAVIYLPFYLIFGDTFAIWSAILVIGIPHNIMAAWGYLGNNTRKLLPQFLISLALGILISVLFYFVLPDQIAYFLFFIYFLWHILCNEQMFESTIKTGYIKWQNSWPVILSWGSIIFVLVALIIAAIDRLGFSIPTIWLWFVLGGLLIIIIREIKLREPSQIPYGYLTFFIVILAPAILIVGHFWKGAAFAPPVFPGIYHIMSWYVFYVKRLLVLSNNRSTEYTKNIFFSWKRNVKDFISVILILQLIMIILFFVYQQTSFSSQLAFLLAPKAAVFWVVIHITTTILPPKPIKLLNFRDAFSKISTRFARFAQT